MDYPIGLVPMQDRISAGKLGSGSNDASSEPIGGTQVRDNNESAMYTNLMEKFGFGGADKKGVYFDEENRRHLLNIRAVYAEAAGNMADNGKKEQATETIG